MVKISEVQKIAFRKVLDEFTEERIREIIRNEIKRQLFVSAEEIEKAIIEHIRLANHNLERL